MTHNPTADEARLRDHETIWLGPKCEEKGDGRTWAPDNPWGDKCDHCDHAYPVNAHKR